MLGFFISVAFQDTCLTNVADAVPTSALGEHAAGPFWWEQMSGKS